MPEIQDEIEKTIIVTRDSIHKLPKPPSSDPRNEIANLLHVFVQDLARHVNGVPEAGLLQTIRPAQEQFRRSIRSTAPDFRPFERRYAQKKSIHKAEFLLGEEGHEDFAALHEPVESGSGNESVASSEGPNSSEDIVPNPDAIYIDEVMQRADEYVSFLAIVCRLLMFNFR